MSFRTFLGKQAQLLALKLVILEWAHRQVSFLADLNWVCIALSRIYHGLGTCDFSAKAKGLSFRRTGELK